MAGRISSAWRAALIIPLGIGLLTLPASNRFGSAEATTTSCVVVVEDASPIASQVTRDGDLVVVTGDGTVLRRQPDGAPDRDFGIEGVRRIEGSEFGGDAFRATGLLVRDENTIILGEVDFAPVLVALDDAGDRDASFGADGVVSLDVVDGSTVALTATSDGGIAVLLQEYTQQDNTADWVLVALTATGERQAGFGDDGVGVYDETVAAGPATLTTTPNGRLLVALRQVPTGEGGFTRPGVLAVDASGEVDRDYGVDGGATLPGYDEIALNEARLGTSGDGTVLLVQAFVTGEGDVDVLFRFDDDGGLDGSFGSEGQVRIQGAHPRFGPSALAVTDDRILVGRLDAFDATRFEVIAVTSTGDVDTSFATDGLFLHTFDGQSDGDVVDLHVVGERVRLVTLVRLEGVNGPPSLATIEVDASGTVVDDCAPQGTTGDPVVSRVFGEDRYATAAAVSRSVFPRGADTVYVATGTDYPDALAGTPVAVRDGAPLLLVSRDAIPAVIDAELARLAPDRIVVVGGPVAVSDAVERDLGRHGDVTRVAGENRFETAAAISRSSFEPGVEEVWLATGGNFPDALAGGTAAGLLDFPILLVEPDAIPEATRREIERLQPDRLTLLGGYNAISFEVEEELTDTFGGGVYVPSRYFGNSRYGTATSVASQFDAVVDFSGQVLDPVPAVYLATGTSFPDALAAGAAAAARGAPLLLVPRTELLEVVRDRLARLGADEIVVLGGDQAISDDVVDALKVPGTLQHTFYRLGSETSPTRWNPCEPIRWVVNPDGAPVNAMTDIREAIGRVAAATGIEFVDEGIVDEPARFEDDDYAYQPSRYGPRAAPLLIAFADFGDGTGFYKGLGQGGFQWNPGNAEVASQVLAGHVTIAADHAWENGGFDRGSDFGPIVLHELGHALGLDHTVVKSELMFPVVGNVTDLGIGDRAGLQVLGAGSGCLPSADTFVP